MVNTHKKILTINYNKTVREPIMETRTPHATWNMRLVSFCEVKLFMYYIIQINYSFGLCQSITLLNQGPHNVMAKLSNVMVD